MSKKDTASGMLKLVKQFKDSGQTQKAFSAAHGIKEGKLHYWISKFNKSNKTVSVPKSPEQHFIPIALSSEQEHEFRSIVIRCTNGVEIEIPL